MKTRRFCFFLPRRKDGAVNAILLFLLCCLLYTLYFSHFTKFVMPPQEGFTWVRPMRHQLPGKTNRSLPGNSGKGVRLKGEALKKGNEDMKKWFMNVAASDLISLDRSLPDARAKECRGVVYPEKLPSASVIIIFTDEAWSPLMRTVHSVVNRSPHEYLHEVILVDDFSQRDELQVHLVEYIERFNGLVRIERSKDRLGLVRAKLLGGQVAKGDVVVFLDSHCEVNKGWLEPLLARIKENRKAILCPVIDSISAETMEYSSSPDVTAVGGFTWSLHFTWEPIPVSEVKRRTSSIMPVRSPTMAGGLLAADRKFFFEIGGYDPGMDIWGGENLEISFRVWMCGGSIEFIPCSHVGHIFRAGHPYNMTGPGGNLDVHGTNSKRLAEVWMDDYKRFYYLHRIELKNKDVGDLSERKALRKNLQCHSFRWYLDNVIPEKFVFDENVRGFGAVQNEETELCLDTLQRNERVQFILGIYNCQKGGSSSQIFSLTNDGLLRRELTCASPSINDSNAKVKLGQCYGSEDQKWIHENGLMRNVKSDLCIDAKNLNASDDILLKPCNNTLKTQLWSFKNLYNDYK